MSSEIPDHVTLDFDRARRCGFPEVVFAEGKDVETLTPADLARLAVGYHKNRRTGEISAAVATRASSSKRSNSRLPSVTPKNWAARSGI